MKGLQEIRQPASEVASTETAQRSLLQRIAASQTFQRSTRLRDLLVDIGEHSLAAQTDELSEHAIGVRVFGRPDNYNPSEDNIVRSSVRQLRVKLKDYFDSEGRSELIIVDIPKGSYLAVFHERPVANLPTPTSIVETAPHRQERRTSRLTLVLVIACAALLASCVGLAEYAFTLPAPAHEARSLMAVIFNQSSGPVRFVLTDSVLVLLNAMGSTTTVDNYADQKFFPDVDGRAPEATRNLFNTLKTRQITSLADVQILFKLMQNTPDLARRIELKHAKHMSAREFKEGNFIVTGSPVSNPWSALFDSSSNFQIDPSKSGIRNVAPIGSEPAEFLPIPEERIDVARIALLKNLSGNGLVLLIAGRSMEGTEGAGEFLLRDDSLPLVRKTLRLRASDPIPSFELALQVRMLEGTARSSRIIAWRRH